MADPKKLLSKTPSSSLLTTNNNLLASKPSTSALNSSSSSLLQGSTLLSSSSLSTKSSFLSNIGSIQPSSLLSSTFSSNSLLNKPSAPASTSFSLINTAANSLTTFTSIEPKKPSPSFLQSSTILNSSTLTTESSLTRKRKAENVELPTSSLPKIQENIGQTSTKTDSKVTSQVKYNNENIVPLQVSSSRLIEDLHCNIPAPKRPRIDPFHSIFTSLENQKTKDEDAAVGIKSIKKSLLNALADSLLSQPDFKKATDPKRTELLRLSSLVVDHDPEFILKAALYTRNHLNIRVPANFLVAFAAFTDPCRIFLKKYYKLIVNLPSDWIEIAELYQTFIDKRIHFGSLPAALRRVMMKKFPDFDKYQLAKYNKEKARLKKAKKANEVVATTTTQTSTTARGRGRGGFRGSTRNLGQQKSSRKSTVVPETTCTEERETRRLAFTLKRLIRQLHISEPVEHVWCLLGKRYPETSEAFYLSRLPGVFEPERVNKRMKLPTPETWETQISLKGNKPEVWQKLIDNKKLPFMAMLRNLRNMIKVGISEKHHQWVLKKLQDEGAVMHSRQFPFRFFSAYQIFDELEEDFKKWCEAKGVVAELPERLKRVTRKQKGKKKMLSKEEKAKKLAAKEMPYDLHLLERYRKALDGSIKIATKHNCQPIAGRTFVFCNLSTAMSQPCQAAKGLGKPKTRAEIGLLMGLMCKSACECSRLITYKTKTDYTEVQQRPQQTILQQVSEILEQNIPTTSTSEVCIPPDFLTQMIAEKQWFDNIILVSDGLKSDTAESDFVYRFLKLYRYLVNSELMFVSIDLSISQCSLAKSDRFNNRNDIFLSGFSDAILQFIAERGNDGQLLHVENIDNSYNLSDTVPKENLKGEESKQSDAETSTISTPLTTLVPRWRTVRVFISSTFKDMHAERDLLTRYVFPELRQRAKSLFINLYQTDLRWGIAESQTKQSVFLCLNEVYRSDYIIGLIGERYGYIPTSYDVPQDDPRFSWLRKLPIGYSITDLELQAGALNSPSKKQNRAFFYFRDRKYLTDVPYPWLEDFVSENEDASQRIQKLKDRIRSSGFETFDGYPCSWHGVQNDRPLVTNLEQFARRVIDNIWGSLQKEYKPEYVMMDDQQIEDTQHHQFRLSFMEHFVSRTKVLQDAVKAIGLAPIIAIVGQPGSGKTAALAAIVNNLTNQINFNGKVYEHYVGITRSSLNCVSMLRRLLCQIINDHLELKSQFPLDQIRMSNYTELCKIFAGVCEMRQQKSNLVICIDGIELLDNETLVHTLNFIPKNFDFNHITFILTANEDSVVEKACKSLSTSVHINISNLELLERTEIVRKLLDRFGKKLDENAFSSQMKYITSKRDSFKPSYLTMLCEELLLMTDYETQITEKLKAIPQRQNLFLMEIFKRLDTMFGENYVGTAFGLMYSARQDLTEQELRDLMNLSFVTDKKMPPLENYKYPMTTTPLQLADFIYNCHILLKPQLYDGPQTISMSSNEIRQIVKNRYIRTTEQQIKLYKLLAFYYWCEADGPRWISMNTKAFEDLPSYLYMADEKKLYFSVLSDLKFITSKVRVGLVQSLIDDYELHKLSTKTVVPSSSSIFSRSKPAALQQSKEILIDESILNQYRSFIQRNGHIFAVHPSLVYQQAMNELETSAVFENMQRTLYNDSADPSTMGRYQIDAFVRINKQESMEQMKYSIEDFGEPTRRLAMSPSGKYLAVGTADCLTRLYNTSTSRLLKLFVGHAAPISALTFVGDDRLVTGTDNGELSVWDVSNGHRLHKLSPSHNKRVACLSSNKRGTQFASVSWDSYVYIWNIQNGRKETEITIHPKPVSSVAFHPDGFMLVTGCWDGIVRQWNVATGQRRAVMRGHLSSIRAVSYSADGRYVASCSIDGECRLWNALTGSQVGLISARISSINFSPNGSNLASAGYDGRVRVFSSTIGQCQMIIRHDSWGPVSSLVIDSNGEYIVAGYHSGTIRVFDVQNGSTEQEFHHQKGRIHRLVLKTGSENMLLSASADSSACIYRLKNFGSKGNSQPQVMNLSGHTAGVLSCAINKYGLIATGSEDTTICLYNARSLSEKSSASPNQTLTQHRTPVTGLTFDRSGSILISASRDAQVSIWTVARQSTTTIATLQNSLAHCHADWINDIALSNTNKDLLVTASNDNTLKIWNINQKEDDTNQNQAMDSSSLTTVAEAKVNLCGHQGSVNSVCFAYGCVVSGSLDNTVRVWSHKGTEVTCLRGHTEKVTSCDLWVKLKGADSKENDSDTSSWANMVDEDEAEISRSSHSLDQILVVSGSEDGSIRVWRPTDPEQRCVYDAHAQPLNDVVVSNESIITASLDKTVRSWHIPTNAFVTADSSAAVMTPAVPELTTHLDEVMSIAVSSDNKLVFTVSRDAHLYVWSLLSVRNEENLMDTGIVRNNMSKKPFRIIQSLKAHDESILAMDLVRSQPSKHVVVTGSVDRTIKFWSIEMDKKEEQCSIKRLKLDRTTQGPVSMICAKLNFPIFVVGENSSFDHLILHLYSTQSLERLKTYQTKTCQWPLSSILTMDSNKHCYLTVGSSSHELCHYDLTFIEATDSNLLSSIPSTIEKRQSLANEWITSIDVTDDQQTFYCGTADGNFYSTSSLFDNISNWSKSKLSRKKSAITGLCTINNEFVFTSGFDNVIRVQYRNSDLLMDIDEDHQTDSSNVESDILGQYPVTAPITRMRCWKKTNTNVFGVIAGDVLGNLYLVQWYRS